MARSLIGRGERKIKYEAELDSGFARGDRGDAGWRKAVSLYPVRDLFRSMSFEHLHGLPPAADRGAMTLVGFKDEVFHSITIWLYGS